MSSFELDIIDEKTRAGAEFLMRVVQEMQRALVTEKSVRKLTQQSIAEKMGTSRHVVNRELQGLENVSARRIGEFFWAIGWEPHFLAKKPSAGNCELLTPPAPVPTEKKGAINSSRQDPNISGLLNAIISTKDAAPVPVV